MLSSRASAPRHKQRGVALLTAMFVVFLASFASVELVYSLQLAINRSALVLGQRQAWQFALGGEWWALEELRRDQQRDLELSRPRDWRAEDWASKQIAAPIEGGSVSGYIADLQGRFNVNNLVTAEGQVDELQAGRLRRLVQALELDEVIVDAIIDWVDRNSEPEGLGGAETGQYLLRTPPYLAPNAPMADVSELSLLEGVDAVASARLREHLCALPPGTPLNVNTANAYVLMSLHPDISLPDAESLVQYAEDNPAGFESKVDFLAQPQLAGRDIPEAGLEVYSSFFEANVVVSTVYGEIALRSVLQRVEDGRPRVVSRSLGLPE